MNTASVRHLVGAALGITTLLAIFLVAFTWPVSESAPHDVPVAVVGPPEAAAALEQGTSTALGEDSFALTELGSREDAVRAIEDRDVYGAFVFGPDGAELLVAPSASPAVAELLERVAEQAQAQGQPPVTVTDVAPLPTGDPLGGVFRSGALPMVLGGIITGAALWQRLRDRRLAVVGALTVSAIGGLVLGGLLQGWLDVLGGSYLANAGVIALGLAAVSLSVVGLASRLGLAGIGIGALTMVLLGNPLSGVASAPELLPEGWGALGQLLPPGALGSALRSTAYFDGAGAAVPLLVLTGWALAGLALALLPRRARAVTAAVDQAPQPASV